MAQVLHHSPLRTPQVTWATLFKIVLAAAAVYLWFLLWRVVLLGTVALIVAVALLPPVDALERRGWPRWVASASVMLLLALALGGFTALTFTSLISQAE